MPTPFMPTPGKRGLKPFVHTKATLDLMAVAEQTFKALGPPPAQCYPWHDLVESATGGDWGMLGNDSVGDCVVADDGHQVLLWTANQPSGKIVVPTTADALAYYSALTGYDGTPGDASDQGCDPVANADYLKATGITVGGVVHKVDAWVPVDPSNAAGLKWATHLFGGVKFCVNLPQSAETQFGAGQPWTVLADDGGILGGHDILNVYYYTDAQGNLWWLPVTWGQTQTTSEPWRAKYLDMAIAVLSKDFVNQQGMDAAGLDYSSLVAMLNSAAQA
jgi:hypothetical protein